MSRRNAREAVLQALFQLDVGLTTAARALQFALENTPLGDRDLEFARSVYERAVAEWQQAGDVIATSTIDWDVERLNRVDRSLLRLALAELSIAAADTPVGVVINEAVELAKLYSTEDSGKFINGILGQLVKRKDQE